LTIKESDALSANSAGRSIYEKSLNAQDASVWGKTEQTDTEPWMGLQEREASGAETKIRFQLSDFRGSATKYVITKFIKCNMFILLQFNYTPDGWA
jgi:hypothetical protein